MSSFDIYESTRNLYEKRREAQLKHLSSLNAKTTEKSDRDERTQNNGGFLGGLGFLGEKVAVGFVSSLEGIWDYSAGGLAKLFGADDWAEEQFDNDWFGDWYSHPEEWYNPSGGWKVAGDVAGGIGTSLPAIAGTVAGAAITAGSGGSLSPLGAALISGSIAGLGAAGNATKQAYRETGELGGKEFGYGALVGLTEGAIEGVSGAIGTGTGQVVKGISKAFAKETTKTVAKQSVMKTLGKGFIGEAFEEGVAEILDPHWQRLTYNPDAENATLQEVAYAAFVGGLSGMIMSGGQVATDSASSFIKGNNLASRGLDTEVIGLSEQFTTFEKTNNTGDETFQALADTYTKLVESLAQTGGKVQTVTQKKLLGDLQRANTVAVFKPMILRSAANIVNNAEAIAQKLNEYGYKGADGKPITVTAEQIRAGVDVNNTSSFSKALKENNILRTLAVTDATGHLTMDTARFKQATLAGQRLASQVDLNRFMETATPEEINAVSEALGIEDWSTLNAETFNQKVVEFVESGRAAEYAKAREGIQDIHTIPESAARPMPKLINLRQDGTVRYTDGDTKIAITKSGDTYTIYDYSSGKRTKSLTRAEVNKILRDYNVQKTDILAGAKLQVEQESTLKKQAAEIDAYARENIPDYAKLSDANKSMIRKVIREGRALGLAEADILAYAAVSAHSGLNIVYDKKACYQGKNEAGEDVYYNGFFDPHGNRIVVNPESKNTQEKILLHELDHAIRAYKGKDGKIHYRSYRKALENVPEEITKKIAFTYRNVKTNTSKVELFMDETNAYFAENALSNKNILQYLVKEEPKLTERILSFFKKASTDYESFPQLSKAARSYYKTYKKLFDEFSERNFQNNAYAESSIAIENKQKSVTRTNSENVQVTDKAKKRAFEKADVNSDIVDFVEVIEKGSFKDNDKVELKKIPEFVATQIKAITGIDVSDFKVAVEARQIAHILKDHGKNGITDHSMENVNDIAKMEYVMQEPDSISPSGKTQAYSYMRDGKNRTADTVIYEREIGDKSYYVVQAVADTKKKTLFVVSAFIGEKGYKKGTSQLIDASNSPNVTSEDGSVVVPKDRISQTEGKVNTNSENSSDNRRSLNLVEEKDAEYTRAFDKEDVQTDGVRVYSYDTLIKKDDLSVITLPDTVPLTNEGKVDNKAVVARGKLNARKQSNPNNTNTDTYVYVDDIGLDVLLGAKGLQHGLVRSEETALAVMKIGDILKGSVAVNELKGSESRKTDMSYVLLGACHDDDSLYVVRSVVSKLKNDVTEIDVYQLSAVKGKKTETPNSALKRGAAVAEQSSLISSESPTISIADFLQAVKEIPLINEIFSKDVLEKLGVSRSAGTLSGDVRYSIPLSETEESVAKHRQSYTPNLKEKIFTAKDSIYIDTVDELYGVTAYLRKIGKNKEADALVNTARSSMSQAQTMIGQTQYNIFSDTYEELGEGLQVILRPITARGEKSTASFNNYLLHLHNIDRMTLNKRSIEWNEQTKVELKSEVSKLNGLNKQIEKLNEEIKSLGRKKADLEQKKKLREKVKQLKEQAKNAKKNATQLQRQVKEFVPLEDKPVFGENDERNVAISAEESRKAVEAYEKDHPEYKEIGEKVHSYFRNLNKMRVDAGLISQEDFGLMQKLYPHYVPTYRDLGTGGTAPVKGKNNLAITSSVKRAKGGGADIIDILDAGAEQTAQTIRAARINQIAIAIAEAAETSGDNTYVEIVSREKVNRAHSEESQGDVELRPKHNQITFFKDGEKVTMNVSNEIFKGFEGLYQPTIEFDSFLWRSLNRLNSGYKKLVTAYSPAFMIRNPLRDLQDAGINSKHPALFAKKLVKAVRLMANNSNEWKLYSAMGGHSSSVFGVEGINGQAGTRGFDGMLKLIDDNGDNITTADIFKAAIRSGKNLITAVENANAFIEQIPRFAEFLASLEAGDSVNVAMNNSAEVTTNFGRKGRVAKKLNATIMPFLNPAIQGFDKIFRNVKDAATGEKVVKEIAVLIAKAVLIGITPTILNSLLMGDDEGYEDMREEDKENNFIIKVGDTYIKIPRGRLASVLGGGANRVYKTIQGKDADWDGYIDNAVSQITPVENMSRTIVSPFFDVANNLTWYGSAIEGRQFENTAPKDRYDEDTSSIAIAIGKVLNYSPKKIHYLLDQYSGVIGDFILPATTAKAEKDFISGNFTLDPATSNKLSTQFYELYDETQYAKTSGDDTAIYQVKYLNKVKSAISDMYKQKSEIQSNPDLSNAEKLQQTRVVQILINEAYKTALQDFELYTKAIEATANLDEKIRFTEATRLMYGAERALAEYDDNVYAKSQVLNKAGVDYETFYNYYFATKSIASDKDSEGNTVSGSKRKKVVAEIKKLNVSNEQKLLLICASGYSLQDNDISRISADNAKKRLLRYILNLKSATQAEKAAIAELCGFKVKNGRIITNSVFQSK